MGMSRGWRELWHPPEKMETYPLTGIFSPKIKEKLKQIPFKLENTH
jgi:hypothetical protein